MTRISPIDLSRLPAPDVIESLSFEVILEELRNDYANRYPEFSALLESEPVIKLLETTAYSNLLLRQRVNDAARARMLAFAKGSDLDHLAADFNVKRIQLDAGDPDAIPPIAPTMEGDVSFRLRRQLAPEALTTAGSEGSYKFHALSAGESPFSFEVSSPELGKVAVIYRYEENSFGAMIKDASVTSENPGDVVIAILAHDDGTNQGVPDQESLDKVTASVTDKYTRPLTDNVRVIAATMLEYSVTATLYLYEGPDQNVVRQKAEEDFTKFATSRHILGEEITRSGIDAALQVPGVKKVVLEDWRDVVCTNQQAPYCTSLNLTIAGAS